MRIKIVLAVIMAASMTFSVYGGELFEEAYEADTDSASVIYAVPGGTGDGSSKETPKNLADVFKNAKAGDEIHIPEGRYVCSECYKIQVSGTKDAPIKLVGEGDVVLDFSSHAQHAVLDGGKNNKIAGVALQKDYWDIEGVDIYRAPGVGLQIEGGYNIIKDCGFSFNRDSGLQISGGGNRKSQWAHDNLVINCTSHDNCDDQHKGEDADGFAAKIQLGSGNMFTGCIAYHNSDDGWDLFAKDNNFPNAGTIIVNCVAFGNGYLSDGSEMADGDGNGFKLGSADWGVPNWIKNCVAFGNAAHGFTDNNNTAPIRIENCTAYDNGLGKTGVSGKKNFQFEQEKGGSASGLLSVYKSGHSSRASDFLNGTIENSIIYNSGSVQVRDKVEITNVLSAKVLDAELDENIFEAVYTPDTGAEGYSADKDLRSDDGTLKLGSYFKKKSDVSVDLTGIGADLCDGVYVDFGTEVPPESEQYNEKKLSGKSVVIAKSGKYLNMSDYEMAGGKFPNAAVSNPASFGNESFTVMAADGVQMNLGDSAGEEQFAAFDDGSAADFTKRLIMNGDPADSAGKAAGSAEFNGTIAARVVSFTVEKDKNTTVKAYVWGDSGTPGSLTVYKADGSIYDETQTVPVKSQKFTECSFTVSEEGTYYLGTQNYNKIYLYYLTRSDEDAVNMEPVQETETLVSANMAEKYTESGKDGNSYTLDVTADSIIYNGGKIFLKVAVTDAQGKELTANKDYKVSFKNNKDANLVYVNGKYEKRPGAKQPTYMIKFKGAYKSAGVITKEFDILPMSVKTAQITPKKAEITVKNGAAVKFFKSAQITAGGKNKKLNAKKDLDQSKLVMINVTEGDAENKGKVFTRAESIAAPAGDYVIEITGANNFEGSVTGGAFKLIRK